MSVTKTHHQSSKLVEWSPLERTVPVKILVVGLWRTGTSSLIAACKELGYSEVYPRDSPGANTFNSPSHVEAFNRIIDDKFLHDKPPGIKEFDELFGDCMVISGAALQLFLHELLTAYPTAKVILTTRSRSRSRGSSSPPLDDWHTSILSTFAYLTSHPLLPIAALFSPWIRTRQGFYARVKFWVYYNNIDAYGKLVHSAHVERVRALVPTGRVRREDYLEFEVGEARWEVLRGFLGVQVPEGEEEEREWPRVNDLRSVREMFGGSLIPQAWWAVWKGAVGGLVAVGVGFVALGWVMGGRWIWG